MLSTVYERNRVLRRTVASILELRIVAIKIANPREEASPKNTASNLQFDIRNQVFQKSVGPVCTCKRKRGN